MRVDAHWTQKNIAIATLIESDKSPALYRQIGKNIAAIRESRGLCQVELAQLVVINRNRIFDIEAGRLTARIDALLIHAIAVALGVSIFELLPKTELILDLANKEKVFVNQLETLTLYNEQEHMHFRAQLARNLYLRRLELKMSPTELAKSLGGSQNLARIICKIETVKTTADIFLLLALAHALELSLDAILPPLKINRLRAFVKTFNSRDIITLNQLLEIRLDAFKSEVALQASQAFLDDEGAISRSLFFAEAQ